MKRDLVILLGLLLLAGGLWLLRPWLCLIVLGLIVAGIGFLKEKRP